MELLFGKHINRYYLRYLPAFIIGLIATVVVSLATKAPSQEVLDIYAKATDNSIDD
jgi:hypothetical protein